MSTGGLARLGVRCADASTGIATLGVYCGLASVVVPAGVLWSVADRSNERVLNAFAMLIPNDPGVLKVTSKYQPIADAIVQVVRGDYGFIAVRSNEQIIADAIAKYSMPAGQPEFAPPTARGTAKAASALFEGAVSSGARYLPGIADATVQLFYNAEATLITNPDLQAWGIQNLTEEELAIVIRHLRSRRH